MPLFKPPSKILHRTKFQSSLHCASCKIHTAPLSSNTAKFGELPLHIHLIYCFPSSVTVILPSQPPHSQIETSSLLSVQFPNFLEGLFCIFCNSSVYSLSSGWRDQAHHAVLHMWVPQGFQDHAQHPLFVLTTLMMVTLVAFWLLLQIGKISELAPTALWNHYLHTAPASSEFCFMQSQVWLFPATKTFSNTYSYSEDSRNHQHHYLKTTEHH